MRHRRCGGIATLMLVACSGSEGQGDNSDAAAIVDAAANPDARRGDGAVSAIEIPALDAFSEVGEILTQGQAGDWDLYLWGGFAISVVKRDGTYFLYYQGSDGYDEVEYTVTHRAIGVATSVDGVSFTKHTGNPVISWLPGGEIEEGAASGGALLAGSEVVVYYGANTQAGPELVNADGRVAVSADGLDFADQGVVLDHSDGAVWGAGDELFPVAGLRHDQRWLVYYIPNGSPQRGELGVAWGVGRSDLDSTAPVTSGGQAVPAWGPVSVAALGGQSYAVFVNANADQHSDGNHIDVYSMAADAPAEFTGPVRTYEVANFSRGVVFLDEEADRWMLFHRNDGATAYRLQTAPLVRR